MQRTFDRNGLGYVMGIAMLDTEIAVDRLSRSRGETHGELTITCGLPVIRSLDGHVHQARFNLSSSSARAALARILAQRAPAEALDWAELLEDFCRRVLAAERHGEPVVKVGGLPIPLAPSFRLAPLLPDGQVTILFGEGGVGKSTLACLLGVSVVTGLAIVEGWQPRRAPVLYLNWEASADSINRRVRGIALGAHIPELVTLDHVDCRRRGPLAGFAEDIARQIAAEDYGLVVVDSVGMASGTSAEGADANETAIRLFAAFGYLGTTVLAIDHVSKATADEPGKPARPYGSVYKANLARATFELRRTKMPDGASVLALYNAKMSDADTFAPMALRVSHGDDGSIAYEREEVIPTALTRALTRRERIAHALRREHLTTEELAAILDDDEHRIRTELSRHKSLFSKLPSGAWEVLDHAS